MHLEGQPCPTNGLEEPSALQRNESVSPSTCGSHSPSPPASQKYCWSSDAWTICHKCNQNAAPGTCWCAGRLLHRSVRGTVLTAGSTQPCWTRAPTAVSQITTCVLSFRAH